MHVLQAKQILGQAASYQVAAQHETNIDFFQHLQYILRYIID